jgi:hypothetical protein
VTEQPGRFWLASIRAGEISAATLNRAIDRAGGTLTALAELRGVSRQSLTAALMSGGFVVVTETETRVHGPKKAEGK